MAGQSVLTARMMSRLRARVNDSVASMSGLPFETNCLETPVRVDLDEQRDLGDIACPEGERFPDAFRAEEGHPTVERCSYRERCNRRGVDFAQRRGGPLLLPFLRDASGNRGDALAPCQNFVQRSPRPEVEPGLIEAMEK